MVWCILNARLFVPCTLLVVTHLIWLNRTSHIDLCSENIPGGFAWPMAESWANWPFPCRSLQFIAAAWSTSPCISNCSSFNLGVLRCSQSIVKISLLLLLETTLYHILPALYKICFASPNIGWMIYIQLNMLPSSLLASFILFFSKIQDGLPFHMVNQMLSFSIYALICCFLVIDA